MIFYVKENQNQTNNEETIDAHVGLHVNNIMLE